MAKSRSIPGDQNLKTCSVPISSATNATTGPRICRTWRNTFSNILNNVLRMTIVLNYSTCINVLVNKFLKCPPVLTKVLIKRGFHFPLQIFLAFSPSHNFWFRLINKFIILTSWSCLLGRTDWNLSRNLRINRFWTPSRNLHTTRKKYLTLIDTSTIVTNFVIHIIIIILKVIRSEISN